MSNERIVKVAVEIEQVEDREYTIPNDVETGGLSDADLMEVLSYYPHKVTETYVSSENFLEFD